MTTTHGAGSLPSGRNVNTNGTTNAARCTQVRIIVLERISAGERRCRERRQRRRRTHSDSTA